MPRGVFGLWWGGSSYAVPDLEADLEIFPTLAHARDAMMLRYVCDSVRLPINRADGYNTEEIFPAVSDDCSMSLYLSDPRGSDDPYPDRVLTIGPRGGVRVERV